MAIGIFTLRQQLRGLLSKNWTGTIPTPYVDYLVVGGGGGGGGYIAGGGGAGGALTGLLPVTPGVSYTTTVGGGGAGGASGGSAGTNGQNSVLGFVTAVGGGGGCSGVGVAAGSGGSGGGGYGTNLIGGSGIFGQGNAGATCISGAGGGGGGAGTIGLPASSTTGANGGAGIASSINGTVTPYAGGGGGGGNAGAAGGAGGAGGGGPGGTLNGTIGQANTGGGGGGAGYNAGPGTGGTGGSGIVIISYPDNYAALTTTTGSPTVSTSGSGSISFNGSSQYLVAPSGSGFAFGTADFTIEMWVYPTAGNWTSGNFNIMDGSSNNTGSIEQYINITRYYNSTTGSGSSLYTTGFGAVTANTWTHLAIVRISGTTYLYKNGVLSTSASDGFNYTTQGRTFAATASGAGQYPGYLSNIRIVKGVGVYTGAFTVPAVPLQTSQTAGTNISAVTVAQTSLLLSSISGAYLIDSSANGLSMVATGTPAWNQESPFATGLGYKNRVYTWTSTGTWAVTV